MDGRCKCILGVLVVGILLTIILVPLSFSYVEYYEYGLAQRKTTGSVDTSRVYAKGRYALGPDYKFLKYQADAHVETLRSFSVFSSGDSNSSIGLDFKLDIDFTYLLKKDEIGVVHQELARSYQGIILSRAKDAIKNEAARVTFLQYFQNRSLVETRFRDAVQRRWEINPSLHATLDQFHLGRIQIPESVAGKQLEAKIQNERNDQEAFLQEAAIEREMTAVLVNSIDLETQKVLRTAFAQASLIQSRATSQARQLIADAQTDGIQQLVAATEIDGQEQLTAFTYIRTLQNRRGDSNNNTTVEINYLTPENIVKTRAV
ncbi:SPFH domain / Band 7 family [Seminavis robusta]|uniref:SPFH domain / Band 7 family n=1 Tax=Seminavis robusta TaxID=568900 RepID=A0A9N8DI10_9STRA|nr:SPFH domain / Band 7 family [Seminavis robusta]|eukprot:Sro95_g049250.1 SPFH domain / Band 7 family (318) ;mRNA; f:42236-43189